MSDLNINRWDFMPVLNPYSLEAIGAAILALNGTVLNSTASALYPSANRAIFYPFTVDNPVLIKMLWSYSGSAVAGNNDIGIYTDEGGETNTLVRIVSMGSTVQGNVSALQTYDIADTQLGPGRYYMAFNHSETATGQFFRAAFTALTTELCGIRQSDIGAIALPATVTTFVIPGSPYIPLFGAMMRTTL